jgi:DNA-binding MarR family transcriptional regulator
MSGQQNVSHQIVEIIPLIMRFLHTEMRESAGAMVPSHYRLLRLLSLRSCILSEMAEKQSVTLATMSNSVNTLVERGWIQRIPVSHDRRMVRVELTNAGKKILDESQQRLENRVSQRLNELPPEDLDRLTVGLEILRRVLDTSSVNERSCE